MNMSGSKTTHRRDRAKAGLKATELLNRMSQVFPMLCEQSLPVFGGPNKNPILDIIYSFLPALASKLREQPTSATRVNADNTIVFFPFSFC